MGNACCNREVEEDELSKIKNINSYLIYILGKINEIQQKISDYSNKVNERDKAISFEEFRYYIALNNVLINLKITLEKYLYYEKNQQNTPNDNSIDFSNKKFDVDDGKSYLIDILDTQSEYNIKKLKKLETKMIDKIFVTGSNIIIDKQNEEKNEDKNENESDDDE